MADVDVAREGPEEFRVEVTEGETKSTHEVRATAADVDELGAGSDAETLIRESFRFLLEREPKESILSRFELPVIGRYFPEYPDEIRRRLGGA